MSYAVIHKKNGFRDDLYVVPMRMMERPETVTHKKTDKEGNPVGCVTTTKEHVEVRCIISKELDALESVAALAVIAKKILNEVEKPSEEVPQ